MSPKYNENFEQNEIGLFSKQNEELSAHELDILFEQYKLFVEVSEKLGNRRHSSNIFFLTINTSLITVLTSFLSVSQVSSATYIYSFASCALGVTLCLTWRQLIVSYSQLNAGKFKVIHLLETYLPAHLFFAEWNAVKHGDGSKYTPFTKVESLVPVIFLFLYLFLALALLIRK